MYPMKRNVFYTVCMCWALNVSSQSFGTPTENPFGITMEELTSEFHFPSFADLDNDGDYDLLLSDFDGVYRYYENQGNATDPSFGSFELNPFGISQVDFPNCSCNSMTQKFADIDGDGDMDIIAVHWYSTMYYIAENIGNINSPNFEEFVADSTWLPAGFEYGTRPGFDLVDIDNDGDLDFFTGEDSRFAFRENIGSSTNPDFTSDLIENPYGIIVSGNYLFPRFSDIDNDGDYDLFIGNTIVSQDDFLFYENVGTASSPIFEERDNNPFNLTNSPVFVSSLNFIDIDGDDDMDLFVGGRLNPSKNLYYYENWGYNLGLTTSQNSNDDIIISPNPSTGVINIFSEEQINKVEVYSILGKLEFVYDTENIVKTQTTINISNLPNGNYIILIRSENNLTTRKVVKH